MATRGMLDSDLLRRIMSGEPLDGYSLVQYMQQQGGDSGTEVPGAQQIVQKLDGDNRAVYDTSGQHQFDDTATGGDNMKKFLATVALMYGGASALNGGFGGAGLGGADAAGGMGLGGSDVGLSGAADIFGGANPLDLGGLLSSPEAMTNALSMGGASSPLTAALAGGGAAAGGALGVAQPGGSGGAADIFGGGNPLDLQNILGSPEAATNALNMGGAASPLTAAAGGGGLMSGGNLARLAGAAAGVADSRDRTQTATQTGSQTSQREPWGPAADWLKQQISSGQDLQRQYQANPLNSIQQQGAQQKLGLLGALNSEVLPGLLGGLGGMSAGYQRPGGPAPRPNSFNFNPQGLLAGMQQPVDFAALFRRG